MPLPVYNRSKGVERDDSKRPSKSAGKLWFTPTGEKRRHVGWWTSLEGAHATARVMADTDPEVGIHHEARTITGRAGTVEVE